MFDKFERYPQEVLEEYTLRIHCIIAFLGLTQSHEHHTQSKHARGKVQCHLIHLTVLMRFSETSLAYMCIKVA